jgi:hypothetical protein
MNVVLEAAGLVRHTERPCGCWTSITGKQPASRINHKLLGTNSSGCELSGTACSMDSKGHWENVCTTKAPDAVSWYRPQLETSLALIERAADARTASTSKLTVEHPP